MTLTKILFTGTSSVTSTTAVTTTETTAPMTKTKETTTATRKTISPSEFFQAFYCINTFEIF